MKGRFNLTLASLEVFLVIVSERHQVAKRSPIKDSLLPGFATDALGLGLLDNSK